MSGSLAATRSQTSRQLSMIEKAASLNIPAEPSTFLSRASHFVSRVGVQAALNPHYLAKKRQQNLGGRREPHSSSAIEEVDCDQQRVHRDIGKEMHEEAPSCYCPYDLILSSIVGRTARTTLFAGVAGLVVIFAWFLLPETKLAKYEN